MKQLILTTLFVLLFGLTAGRAYAECPENPSCEELGQCRPHETFKIDFSIIERCRAQGFDTPPSWRPKGGMGGVVTGGLGSLSVTGRNKPGQAPLNQDGSPGGADAGITFPPIIPGGGDKCPGASPNPNDECSLEGLQEDVSTKTHKCGAVVPLGPEVVALTKDYTSVAMNEHGDHTIKLFNRNGQNLSYDTYFEAPKSYCKLEALDKPVIVKEGGKDVTYQYHAVKIPIAPLAHYHQIHGSTDSIPLTMIETESGKATDELGVVTMKRDGKKYEAPQPNPEWFTSKNALPSSIAADCIPAEVMFTQPTPKSAEIRYQNNKRNYCTVGSIFPEGEDCAAMRQSFDLESLHLYVPSGKRLNVVGNVQNRSPFGNKLVMGQPGEFTVDAAAVVQEEGSPSLVKYNGSLVMTRGGNLFYMSTGIRTNAEHTLIGGATLHHPSGRTFVVPSPGRIQVFSSGKVIFYDGATVFNESGIMLRIISPSGNATGFQANGIIRGTLTGNVLSTDPLPIATSAAQTRLPFDTNCGK